MLNKLEKLERKAKLIQEVIKLIQDDVRNKQAPVLHDWVLRTYLEDNADADFTEDEIQAIADFMMNELTR